MPDFITLTCPSCGGKLKVTDDMITLACVNCGNEHVINRGGGIISLSPILKKVTEVKQSVSQSLDEISKIRNIRDIDLLEKELKKWIRKDGRVTLTEAVVTIAFSSAFVVDLCTIFIVKDFIPTLISIPIVILAFFIYRRNAKNAVLVKAKIQELEKKIDELKSLIR